MDDLSDFDREALAQRRMVQEMMQRIGLVEAANDLREAAVAAARGAPARPKAQGPPKPREPKPPAEIRRSTRERKEVNYADDEAFRSLAPSRGAGQAGAVRRRGGNVLLTEEEVEALRALQINKQDGEREGKMRGPRDSGKGYRIMGGKVYDSAAGVCCHWCRQKTVGLKATCTSEKCTSGRRMPISFCEGCLRNRHGEDVELAAASGCWVCPCCRGSCGPGCVSCCNCGPCRKKAELPPTGQLARTASAAGYTNVHDYLVGSATRESQEELTERKLQQPWAGWLRGEVAEGGEEEGDGEEEEDEGAQGGTEEQEDTVGEPADEEEEEAEDEEEAVEAPPRGRSSGRSSAAARPAAKRAAVAAADEEAGAAARPVRRRRRQRSSAAAAEAAAVLTALQDGLVEGLRRGGSQSDDDEEEEEQEASEEEEDESEEEERPRRGRGKAAKGRPAGKKAAAKAMSARGGVAKGRGRKAAAMGSRSRKAVAT